MSDKICEQHPLNSLSQMQQYPSEGAVLWRSTAAYHTNLVNTGRQELTEHRKGKLRPYQRDVFSAAYDARDCKLACLSSRQLADRVVIPEEVQSAVLKHILLTDISVSETSQGRQQRC